MIRDLKDPRYAAGGGQPVDTESSSTSKATMEELKAAEIAQAMSAEPGKDKDVTASFKKKKKNSNRSSEAIHPPSDSKSSKSVDVEGAAELGGGEGGPRRSQSRSPSPPELSHDSPNNAKTNRYSSSSKHGRFAADAASVSSFRTFTSVRSVDPEAGEHDTIGEIWEVSRPPGLVRDGGTDHGYFYVPSPASSDGNAFHAFLNNQKYTTRRAPCVDWRSWIERNPSRTLIHFSEVPREALVKGRHILDTKPGSAFFSRAQLAIEGEEVWEDSGSYAQMFTYVRGGDADGSTLRSNDGEDDFQQWRAGRGGSRGIGGQGNLSNIIQREDPNSVSFLRKGFNQNIVAGMVAFTGPGLFNAMQGLGNAGGSDPKVAATMNATLYATFSIFGVLSGSLFNLLGTKILMSFGALTYAFYSISVYLWGQVDESYAAMAVAAAAILGIGAACLWGAQGTMTLSYALENQKGLFFGIFWLIFNMGGVMGGFISMGINMSPDEDRATSVTPETYFTFCALMISGSILAFFFVLKPSRVIKADGTAVEFEQTDAAEGLGELKQVAKLFGNKYMLLLTPLIIQSNWFYAYEFGGINGLLFDAPTRGLNSAVYWGISGISSYVGGTYYLDRESIGARRQRAIRGLLMISAINIGQWVYALIYQFSTGYDKGNVPDPLINYSDGAAFAVPFILFMYCGLADSLVQTYAYWIIGAISNNPKQLSMYVGYYKGVQSFGAALSWIIEAQGTSYRTQLLICSFLAVLFIPPTLMVARCVQDKGSIVVSHMGPVRVDSPQSLRIPTNASHTHSVRAKKESSRPVIT
ncbi:hypothetical protein ACHAWX_001786 [Stephanocyclus meneghinianus]